MTAAVDSRELTSFIVLLHSTLHYTIFTTYCPWDVKNCTWSWFTGLSYHYSQALRDTKKEGQYMYNITLWHVHVMLVPP